jgi:flagellar FliL protein
MATSKSTPLPTRKALTPNTGNASRIKRPLLGLLVLLLVSGASIATTWMITSRYQKQSATSSPLAMNVGEAQAAPAPPPPAPTYVFPSPIFLPIQAFTVTLTSEEAERILHVAITLRVGDEASRARIEKYMPEVRNRILMVLSAQGPQSVQTQKGKVDLAQALMQSVNKPFLPQPEPQTVSDVLFTEFVVQ